MNALVDVVWAAVRGDAGEGTAAAAAAGGAGECSDVCEELERMADGWGSPQYYPAHRVHQSPMGDPNLESEVHSHREEWCTQKPNWSEHEVCRWQNVHASPLADHRYVVHPLRHSTPSG